MNLLYLFYLFPQFQLSLVNILQVVFQYVKQTTHFLKNILVIHQRLDFASSSLRHFNVIFQSLEIFFQLTLFFLPIFPHSLMHFNSLSDY